MINYAKEAKAKIFLRKKQTGSWKFSIGNEQLSRTFKIVNGKLQTGTITNILGDSSFTPAEVDTEISVFVTKVESGVTLANAQNM